MSNAEQFQERLTEAISTFESLKSEDFGLAVSAVAEAIITSLDHGGKVMFCGNGGSSADAQHLAAEFVGRFQLERRPLPAIALADNVAALTAIANDYSYDLAFVRAVNALGKPGDVLVGISTSGSSANVIAALQAANDRGLVTVALVGAEPNKMAEVAKLVLSIPSRHTARIQEAQQFVGHCVCELVEAQLCGD